MRNVNQISALLFVTFAHLIAGCGSRNFSNNTPESQVQFVKDGKLMFGLVNSGKKATINGLEVPVSEFLVCPRYRTNCSELNGVNPFYVQDNYSGKWRDATFVTAKLDDKVRDNIKAANQMGYLKTGLAVGSIIGLGGVLIVSTLALQEFPNTSFLRRFITSFSVMFLGSQGILKIINDVGELLPDESIFLSENTVTEALDATKNSYIKSVPKSLNIFAKAFDVRVKPEWDDELYKKIGRQIKILH